MYQTYQLKNKANIHLIPLQNTKSVTTLVMYPVGSRYETEKLRGISHFIEHIMFKGTNKRSDTLTLTREIDRLGAEYNAFTGKEYTGYYIKTDVSYTEKSLDILSDMLFNSKFEAEEIEREKGPIVEEIRMYRDNPIMNIENIFEDVMYAGCPLGRDIAGTEKHVTSFKRQDLVGYRDQYYQPNNMQVIVAGAITEKTKKLIEQYFGDEKSEKDTAKIFKPYCFGPDTKTKRIDIQNKPTDQSQLMLGFPAYPYEHKSNPTVGVMNSILGASMSSRLFIRIRERLGLAYMIKSGTERFHDTGYLFVRAGLEAKNINKAIAVTKEEIEKVIKKGVTDRELKDAKTHIRGALTLSLEDSSAQANWYASQILFAKKIKTPEEKLQEIDAVTNKQIMEVAKEVFDFDKMRVAAIGNLSKEDVNF